MSAPTGEPASALVCPGCNLILITIDTLRADHLPCYGYKRATAPFICSLARREGGVLFENVFTPIPFTLPAHLSILSGLYPDSHGVFTNHETIDRRLLLLQEVLQQRGYRTSGAANVQFFEDAGIDQGFADFRVIADRGKKRSAEQITRFGIEVLERHDRFFLWLHYFQVHEIYEAIDRYHRLYPFDPAQEGLGAAKMVELAWYGYVHGLAEPGKSYVISQYDGNINYIDDKIKQLFAALKRANKLKNTIVVITSDHGETLGEKRSFDDLLFGHYFNLEDEQLRVPLILLHPTYGGAKRLGQHKSLIDIFPSVLGLLGFPLTTIVDGRSLFDEVDRTLFGSLFPMDAADALQSYKVLRFPVGSLILSPKERRGLDPFKREQSFLDIYINARVDAAAERPGCLDRECRLSHTPGRLDPSILKEHGKKIAMHRTRILEIIRRSIGCTGREAGLATLHDARICFRYPAGGRLLKRRRTDHLTLLEGDRRETIDRFESAQYLQDRRNRARIEKLMPALGRVGAQGPRGGPSPRRSKKTIERLRALGYIQ